MRNTFLISTEEENRIRRLHESTKQSPGTGNLITEQNDKGGDLAKTYIQNIYNELKKFEPFKSNPNQLSINLEDSQIFSKDFKDVNGKQRDFAIAEKERENYGNRVYVYMGFYEKDSSGKYKLNKDISVKGKYPLLTIISFQRESLIPGSDGKQ